MDSSCNQSNHHSRRTGFHENARTLISEEVFQGKRLVVIRHENQDYRLQITKANKLILVK